MNAKTWLGVAVVGAGAMAWWLGVSRGAGSPESELRLALRPEAVAPLAPFPVEAPGGSPPPASEGRSAVSATAPAAESAPLATRSIHGRVLDSDALPLAGVVVEYRGSGVAEDAPLTVTSGPGGRFEFSVPRGGGELWARDRTLVTVARGRVSERSEVEPLVVVRSEERRVGKECRL